MEVEREVAESNRFENVNGLERSRDLSFIPFFLQYLLSLFVLALLRISEEYHRVFNNLHLWVHSSLLIFSLAFAYCTFSLFISLSLISHHGFQTKERKVIEKTKNIVSSYGFSLSCCAVLLRMVFNDDNPLFLTSVYSHLVSINLSTSIRSRVTFRLSVD